MFIFSAGLRIFSSIFGIAGFQADNREKIHRPAFRRAAARTFRFEVQNENF